jgi:tetratricopeptide (TPR) repeat protein
MPGNARGQLALAELLLMTRRPQEAESLLRQLLQQPVPEQMRGRAHKSLGQALYQQNRHQEALENYEKSAALNPELATDAARVDILQRLKRYEEAAALSNSLIARDPGNRQWHHFHNDLMYRLGSEDYLKSFDRAPQDGGAAAVQG